MDEPYLLACACYVELSPVRAKLVRRAQDWRWSSARAHLGAATDPLADAKAVGALGGDWKSFLASSLSGGQLEAIRARERTGRPLGSIAFVGQLERRLKRPLARRKPGPKPGRDKRKAA